MELPTRLYHRYIRVPYGTHRGMVRLWIAWFERASGRLADFVYPDLARVERLVFICSGNVCRSPYAELIAREFGLPCASFGLSTATGKVAYGDALDAALRLGRDLSEHRTTSRRDFKILESDLLLVMEVRQAHAINDQARLRNAQVALLGNWAEPTRPHIHDPMTLSADYFAFCYGVIESAVRNLGEDWRAAREELSGPVSV